MTTLTVSLALLGAGALHAGDMAAAVSMMSEEVTLAGVTGAAPHLNTRLHLAALRGGRQEATALIEEARTAARTRDKGLLIVFADRARVELRATGERARRVTPDSAASTDHLTPHELNIARLAAGGTPSREIAARLFLSPRTTDAPLRNIFKKLGITSRRQLAAVFPQ